MQVKPWEVKLVQQHPFAQQGWKGLQQCENRVTVGRTRLAEVERCESEKANAQLQLEQGPAREQHGSVRERRKWARARRPWRQGAQRAARSRQRQA